MKRNNTGCRFRLAVAVGAKLKKPDAICLLDVRRLQLRNLFEPGAGISANQARPWQRRRRPVLDRGDFKSKIPEQNFDFCIGERLIVNVCRLDALTIKWICRCLLSSDGALK